MASRMIHYLIAKKILEVINVEDRNAFLLGAIIPDAWSFEENPKKKNLISMWKSTGKEVVTTNTLPNNI